MQNCPQFVVAYYAILRADAVVVPVNPMNRAEEFKHYITDPQAQGRDHHRRPGAASSTRPTPRCRPAQRLQQLLVTHYTDAMPDGAIDPGDAPPPAMADWLRADPPLPRGRHALDRRAGAPASRPARTRAQPDDLARAALHLGHHRPAQGLHAHAPHADAQRGRRRRCGATPAPRAVALGVVPMFHITGMMYGVLHARSAAAPPWC